MKITVVCDTLGAVNNGDSVAAINLIEALRARDNDVVVICSDEDKQNREDYVVTPRFGFGSANSYKNKKEAERLIEPIVWDSDVVYIMQPRSLGRVALKCANKHLIPVAAGFSPRVFSKGAGIVSTALCRKIYGDFYSRVDAVRYPTEDIRRLFEDYIGEQTKGFVIPRYVGPEFMPKDVEKPVAMRDKLVILASGRFGREKRFETLIDAAASSKHSRDIQLVFAGDGPQKRELTERSEKLRNKPVFNLYPHSRMPGIINYADLAVCPADVSFEASACKEAFACGKPVIISDSKRSAAKDLAFDDNGLFSCSDPSDLAEKLDYIIENPTPVDKLRKYGSVISERFSRERFADMLEEMFCLAR